MIDEPTRCQTDPTFLFIMSYAIVLELNEIKKAKSIAASRRASKYRTMDVYVNCLGNLEINNIKGTLTDDDFSSDLCYNLFALLLLNSKRPLPMKGLLTRYGLMTGWIIHTVPWEILLTACSDTKHY